MTVSRVVNREPNVSEPTRQRVLAAIDSIGYVPNNAARVLASGKQVRMALLHSNPSAAYLSEFLMGSLAEAADHDIQLVVEHVGTMRPAELADQLLQHRTDAVLLPPPLCDMAALTRALAQAGLPYAQIATARPEPDAVAVTIDDEAAALAMTRHLIDRGHRRIGFIEGSANQSVSAFRRAGYLRALSEGGLPFDPALIAAGDFTYRSGLAAAGTLLDLPARPTAIFASNDDMAAATVAAAHRSGLDVPRDLSVCGFDDTAMATTIWPELTTIRQPVAEMARIAVRLLEAAIRGTTEAPERQVRLAFELVKRNSDSSPGA